MKLLAALLASAVMIVGGAAFSQPVQASVDAPRTRSASDSAHRWWTNADLTSSTSVRVNDHNLFALTVTVTNPAAAAWPLPTTWSGVHSKACLIRPDDSVKQCWYSTGAFLSRTWTVPGVSVGPHGWHVEITTRWGHKIHADPKVVYELWF